MSPRRLAREVRVSPGAPHHFSDRAALSARGYQPLARELVGQERRPQPQALTALIATYVAFAQRHPAQFSLMFRPELSESQDTRISRPPRTPQRPA